MTGVKSVEQRNGARINTCILYFILNECVKIVNDKISNQILSRLEITQVHTQINSKFINSTSHIKVHTQMNMVSAYKVFNR